MGGTANGLFKRAQTSKTIAEVTTAVSSWESYRTTLDLNRPITSKLAVRLNALWKTPTRGATLNTTTGAPPR